MFKNEFACDGGAIKRVLEKLGFSFPTNESATLNTLRGLPYENLVRVQKALHDSYSEWDAFLLRRIEAAKFHYCGVCDKERIVFGDELPDGWGWMSNGTLICLHCQVRYKDKFGELPEIRRTIDDLPGLRTRAR